MDICSVHPLPLHLSEISLPNLSLISPHFTSLLFTQRMVLPTEFTI